MSLHAALMNGWWTKLKPQKVQSDVSTSHMNSIFQRAEHIPARFHMSNASRVLPLAGQTEGDYLKKKGFGKGFDLPKKEVAAILNASSVSVEAPAEAPAETVAETAAEAPAVELEGYEKPLVIKALREPGIPNTTEKGNKGIASPELLEHINRVYAEAGLEVHVRKTKGGRGGNEGANGAILVMTGMGDNDLITNASIPQLEHTEKALKSMKDHATGLLLRRIEKDLKRVKGVLKAKMTEGADAGEVSDDATEATE